MIHLTKERYLSAQWSGGTTHQIYIFPTNANYADRDFLYRISSATVELEQSEFTALPDYHRWITTLDGSISLTHAGGSAVRLSPYDVYAFDGGRQTFSAGRCTDFNLMLRKGTCRGSLRTVSLLPAKPENIVFQSPQDDRFPYHTMLIFCGCGAGKLTDGEAEILLDPGECALIENASAALLSLTADAPSDFIVAEVQHGPASQA